ncbi:uncharacterized protein [Chelonus insularis]|uniref:uncharacterized protein n=1 Tax=Chelonus insularis TaxID=460826 RepID=UPI00158DB502|nr:uncharacterized protein LOC118064295 [Chelonus insularis]
MAYNQQLREKERFVTKRKLEWLDNVRAAVKRRKAPQNDAEIEINGRRFVEYDQLGGDLWCHICNEALSLLYIEEETQVGLANFVKVRCHNCLALYDVKTAKSSLTSDDTDRKRYDVNLKITMAMLDAGIGVTHLNGILSAANVPSINPVTVSQHEKIVGPVINTLAEETYIQAIRKEKELTILKYQSDAYDEKGRVKLRASLDGAWQTRGNGVSYDSLSGHCSLIGVESGLILGVEIRRKSCATRVNGQCKCGEKCSADYTGSAKSMEGDMAASLIAHNEHLQNENCIIAFIVGDDDASTMCRIRQEIDYDLQKESDLNHTIKSLSNKLWKVGIKNDQKKVIDYLKNAFSYAVKTNKGNPTAVEAAIMNVVDHAFGKHSKCGAWCRFSKNPESHHHNGLPNGQALKGEDLYSSKAPKSRCYSRSDSLSYRVSCASLQKNIGTSYITEVYQKLQVSPGKHTLDFRSKKDDIRLKQSANAKTTEFKLQRKNRKTRRSQSKQKMEKSEGITYSSACGLSDPDIHQIMSAEENLPEDTIPVTFDLETSGFGASAEIVQISARCDKSQYSNYILPSRKIHERVTNVTGLFVKNGNPILRDSKGCRRVQTTPAKDVYSGFMNFLKTLSSSVVLVAHNGITFDALHIIRAMKTFDLFEEVKAVVKGFVDSIKVFKNVEELKSGVKSKGSFKQEELAKDYLKPQKTWDKHGKEGIKMLLGSTAVMNDKNVYAPYKPMLISRTLNLNILLNKR